MNVLASRVLVLASTAAVSTALFGACGASHASGPESSDPNRTIEALQGLDITVTTDQSAYAVGEPVRGRIKVVNRADATVRMRFPNSQRYDFLVRNANGDAVWQWSVFRFFAQVLGEEALSPGDSLTYEEVLAGDFGPGSYSVVGSLVTSDPELRGSATFTVR